MGRVRDIGNEDHFRVCEFDFSTKAATEFMTSVANASEEAAIEMRLGCPKAT